MHGACTESYGAISHPLLFHDSNGARMILSQPCDVPSLELDPSLPSSMIVSPPCDVPSLELDPSLPLPPSAPPLPCGTFQSERPTEDLDYSHFIVGVLSLVLVLMAGIGALFSLRSLEASAVFVYAFFGIGTALLQFSKRTGLDFLTSGIGLSVSVVILVGFGLVELKLWPAGHFLFYLTAAVSASIHIASVWKNRACSIAIADARGSVVAFFASHRYLAISTAGAILCIVAIAQDRNHDLGPSGLLGSLSPIWYLGLLTIVTTIILGRHLSTLEFAYSVVLLALILTCTPVIIFSGPIFSWTILNVGITNYIIVHGTVNSGLDIYQAWPGLFAGMGWLSSNAHVSIPLQEARWWPAVIDLGVLIAFRDLAKQVGLTAHRAWLATAFFCAGSVFQEAYFCPQNIAYLLTIIVYARVFGNRRAGGVASKSDWLVVVPCLLAISITHQITPYMLTVALIALALFGYLKSNWFIAAAIVPALIWASLNLGWVKHNISLDQLGSLFSNSVPTSNFVPGVQNDIFEQITRIGEFGALLPIGVLALVALYSRRDRLSFALAFAAATAFGLIVVTSYGNDGPLRTGLFALPWIAILAASTKPAKSHRLLTTTGVALVLVVAVGYVLGTMAQDYVNAVRPSDLAAEKAFETSAPVGSTVYVIGDDFPSGLTYRLYSLSWYRVLRLTKYRDAHGKFNAAGAVEAFNRTIGGSAGRHYYVMTGAAPEAELVSDGFSTTSEYEAIINAFSNSPEWKPVYRSGVSGLYKFVG